MFPPGFLGYEPALWAVVIPQSAQRLAGHHLADVIADEAQQEEAVSPQVVLRELGEHPRLPLHRLEGAKLLLHVMHLQHQAQRYVGV